VRIVLTRENGAWTLPRRRMINLGKQSGHGGRDEESGQEERLAALPGNNRYTVTLTLKSKEFANPTVTRSVTCNG